MKLLNRLSVTFILTCALVGLLGLSSAYNWPQKLDHVLT